MDGNEYLISFVQYGIGGGSGSGGSGAIPLYSNLTTDYSVPLPSPQPYLIVNWIGLSQDEVLCLGLMLAILLLLWGYGELRKRRAW